MKERMNEIEKNTKWLRKEERVKKCENIGKMEIEKSENLKKRKNERIKNCDKEKKTGVKIWNEWGTNEKDRKNEKVEKRVKTWKKEEENFF